jgi:hypothetical protein
MQRRAFRLALLVLPPIHVAAADRGGRVFPQGVGAYSSGESKVRLRTLRQRREGMRHPRALLSEAVSLRSTAALALTSPEGYSCFCESGAPSTSESG